MRFGRRPASPRPPASRRQVPREDRVRDGRSRTPHRHRARARRVVSAGTAGRCPWGVGPVTAKKLRAQGIEKLIDIRAADPSQLHTPSALWPSGCSSWREARNDRAVVAEHEPKSSGSENTFAHDLTDITDIRRRDRRDGAPTPPAGSSSVRCTRGPSRSRCAITTSPRLRAATTEHATQDEETSSDARSRCSTRRTPARVRAAARRQRA